MFGQSVKCWGHSVSFKLLQGMKDVLPSVERRFYGIRFCRFLNELCPHTHKHMTGRASLGPNVLLQSYLKRVGGAHRCFSGFNLFSGDFIRLDLKISSVKLPSEVCFWHGMLLDLLVLFCRMTSSFSKSQASCIISALSVPFTCCTWTISTLTACVGGQPMRWISKPPQLFFF